MVDQIRKHNVKFMLFIVNVTSDDCLLVTLFFYKQNFFNPIRINCSVSVFYAFGFKCAKMLTQTHGDKEFARLTFSTLKSPIRHKRSRNNNTFWAKIFLLGLKSDKETIIQRNQL